MKQTEDFFVYRYDVRHALALSKGITHLGLAVGHEVSHRLRPNELHAVFLGELLQVPLSDGESLETLHRHPVVAVIVRHDGDDVIWRRSDW